MCIMWFTFSIDKKSNAYMKSIATATKIDSLFRARNISSSKSTMRIYKSIICSCIDTFVIFGLGIHCTCLKNSKEGSIMQSILTRHLNLNVILTAPSFLLIISIEMS